jgi:hypothetical protein
VFSRAVRVLSLPEALPLAAVVSAGLALLALYFAPPPAAPAAAAAVQLLPAPAGVAAGLENGRIRLRWAPSVGAAGYAVYCGTHSGGESEQALLAVAGAARTALVPVIRPGLVQYCRLRATRGRLASPLSAEVHAPQLETPWQELRFE